MMALIAVAQFAVAAVPRGLPGETVLLHHLLVI